MGFQKTRRFIISIFLSSFGINLAALIFPRLRDMIDSDDVINLIKELLIGYSPTIALILGGTFGDNQSETTSGNRNKTIHILALLSVGIYNFLFLWRTLFFAISPTDTDREVIKYFQAIFPVSGVLLSGLLGYFFSKK